MKNKLKGIIVGLLVGLIFNGVVLASVNVVKKELHYDNIKITLDGKEIKPLGSDGSYVEPFIIDGVTYLPVRGIANALNLGVDWDGKTSTVILKTQYASVDEDGLETISVYTVDELIENIGSNRKLLLEAGSYNLSEVYFYKNQYIDNQRFSNGFIIENVTNLVIEGNAEILIDDIQADVLSFENCKNIILKGITVGHSTPNDNYSCEGSVLSFADSSGVSIEDCNLYGCGAIGISASSSELIVNKTNIYDCTFAGISINDSSNIIITDSNIYEIRPDAYGSVCLVNNSNLKVNNSRFFLNNTNEYDLIKVEDYFYNEQKSSVVFDSCIFENNFFGSITNIDNPITKFKNCKFNNCYGTMTEDVFDFVDCEFKFEF